MKYPSPPIAPVSHNAEELTVPLAKKENSYSSFSSDAEQDLHESGNNMKIIDSAQFSMISKDLHLSKRATLKLRHHLRNNFLISTDVTKTSINSRSDEFQRFFYEFKKIPTTVM